MFHITGKDATPIKSTTFSELNMTEKDIEELIKENANLITEDDSLLIVGQQVRNASNAISDLIAINQNGDLVLIEIKRDRKDIETRREAFEFQAIRYAAAFAKIKDIEELINKVYVPFLERKSTQSEQGLTITEQANRNIAKFFDNNEIALDDFNERQQIILVASDFDEQTKSAVAWLNQNGVDLHCYKLVPYQIGDELYISSEKVLPLESYEDYFIDLLTPSSRTKIKRKRQITRRYLPRIDALLEWGVVKEGDLLKVKDHDAVAKLLKNGNIEVDNIEKSLQQWLREVTNWSSVQTYAMTVHKQTGKTLSDMREEYMTKNNLV